MSQELLLRVTIWQNMIGLISAIIIFVILEKVPFFMLLCEIALFYLFIKRSSSKLPKIQPSLPALDIMVPIKDEEKNIVRCLNDLSNIEYPKASIYLCNDRSSDKTLPLIKEWLRGYKGQNNFVLINSEDEPPADFTGKAYVIDKAIKNGHGEVVIVTDVDVSHDPKSALSTVNFLLDNKADIIVRIPFIKIGTYGELPLLFFIFILKMGSWFGLKFSNGKQALSLGTYACFRRDFYEKSGGWNKNRSFPDTFALANYAMENNFTYRVFDDGSREVSARMYEGFAATTKGIIRNTNYGLIKSFPLFISYIIISLAMYGFLKLLTASLFNLNLYFAFVEYVIFVVFFYKYLRQSGYHRSLSVLVSIISPILAIYFAIVSILSLIRTVLDIPIDWRGRPLKVQ